jgi:hypothetical protein
MIVKVLTTQDAKQISTNRKIRHELDPDKSRATVFVFTAKTNPKN